MVRSAADAPADVAAPRTTRERILDVALDLFVEQGYDGTSLREIAEVMGFSKAALYYHFASKDELLLALHLRFHDLVGDLLARLVAADRTPEAWRSVLDELIDAMVDQRQLMLFQQRNQAALARDLHGKHQHDAANEDMEQALRAILSDTGIPARKRIRLAAAMGSMLVSMIEASDAFGDVTPDELAAECRAVVADILAG